MFNYESFRFWLNVFMGNLGIMCFFISYKDAFGTIRNEKAKVEVFFFAFAAILMALSSRLFSRAMDVPSIFSRNHKQMEGIVCDFDTYEAVRMDITGKTLSVVDENSGKTIKFKQVYIPLSLDKGDLVKVRYLKYSKVAAIEEIYGRRITNRIDACRSLGIFICIYLIISMPFYYIRKVKWDTVLNYKQDCYVYVYHNTFIYSMLGVFLVRIQTTFILIIAMLGYYKTSWDWCWGILILLNYLGVFLLRFISEKKFIIMKDKFYYCSITKRMEGSLEEIEEIKVTDEGIKIYAKGEEMKMFCTSKKYVDSFIKKIYVCMEW